MNSVEHYRTLSWICIGGIVVFLLWATFAPNGFPGAPVVVCLMGGSAFAALRLGARPSSLYWQSAAEPAQAPRVARMIVACLLVQTLVWAAKMLGGVAYLPQLASASYGAISDVIWTATILIFVGSRYVKWPKRLARPPKKEFIVVAMAAIFVAAAISLISIMLFEGQRIEPSLTHFVMALPHIFFGSFIEELFLRVLLLTALIKDSRSPNHALVLSSIAFALMHAPGQFLQSILELDYSLVKQAAGMYIPQFVWQLGLGFAMGALWLRTGSIILIVTTHAIFNFGSVWLTGQ